MTPPDLRSRSSNSFRQEDAMYTHYSTLRSRRSRLYAAVVGLLVATFSLAGAAGAAPQAAGPIKIGFSMALTGGLAGSGKAALLAMQIWAEDVNRKGGLLGRRVELVYYDDQTTPATVPGIYNKLLD